MVARRSNTNPLDLDANKLLNVFNVSPCLVGQVVPVGDARCRFLPAGQRVILYLDLGQDFRVGWESVELLALVGVCRCHLDLFKIIEDIQLGQVNGRVVVAGVRVFHNDEIEPTAAARATSRYADFVTYLLELLAECVELLSGEGTAISC